jgi:hypothetical protein
MGGDYTRWTFNPAKDYAELFKQQGRVDLDADWNEFVEIVNRRWRAETIDIIGRAIVPMSTPNAFAITPTGPGQFTIGIGRMYVDGLLAECHGLNPFVYDPILGEVDGSTPVPYDQQPYFPSPPPAFTGATVDLVYLDVWQREVTAIQDPGIREKALGGPDTATRMQTVWQVKVLHNVGAHSCGDKITAWDTLVAPSAGRLTTSTIVPTPSPNPCILSPTGGYRGLENRLYRVEVHVAGTVGGANPAKFKWSRDNASVVSAVDAISAPGGPNSIVTVKTLGRDSVLRFKANDWVEVLDDNSELAGTAGFLTQIQGQPDQTNRTITVQPPIPAGLFDPTKPERHTRVRRWDQRNTGAGSDVDPVTGLINVSAGPLDIEDGIQVSFHDDPTGGQLHVGDYWIFAARTADGTVEPLQNAPPMGILHHYTRLGFMTWAANGTGTYSTPDCRVFWPPPMGGDCTGCCTVTVGDGVNSKGTFTDIQAAINSLGSAGGEVCVGRGVFTVPSTITIDATKKNVIVRGMGWATKLIFAPAAGAGGTVLFDVQNTSHVTLESFFAVAQNAQSMVRITNSQFCVVRDTALINLNILAASGSAFASSPASAVGQSGRAIELAGACVECDIERNTLIGGKGIVSTSGPSATTGTLNGLLQDANGAVIANATLTLAGGAGTSQTTVTNAQGNFSFTSLPAGNYTLSFAAQSAQIVITAGATTTAVVTRATVLTVTTTITPVVGASDVRELEIRDNRILALLVSISLIKTEDCEITANRLLGLNAATIKRLKTGTLTADTIDQFQQTVLLVLTDASTGTAFQGGAILLETAARVTIAENAMTALVGITAFISSELLIENNQILAFVGVLTLAGLDIHITGNLIAGLFIGFVQAGLLVDFICDANVWLGLIGVLFAPFGLLHPVLNSVLGPALEKAGFAASGATVMDNAAKFATSTGAAIEEFSLVSGVKIHHELFMTFAVGIAARPGVLSGDVSIADNSFEFCAQAGISWLTSLHIPALDRLLLPLHVIERNTMNIGGIGVIGDCAEGVFRGNRIQCPQIGFELACQTGVVQDNFVKATATQTTVQTALIGVTRYPRVDVESSFRIVGNRLENGPGHGIVIGNVQNTFIENNVIHAVPGNAIASDAFTGLANVRVTGNDISNCLAGIQSPAGTNGTIILPEVLSDLAVHGNRLSGNTGIGMYLNGGFVESQTNPPTLRLLVQDNSQDGDGGTENLIIATGYAVQFTGNQCLERKPGPLTRPLVILTGQWIVATGNTVLHNQTEGVSSLVLTAYALVPCSAIATSNILNHEPQIHGTFAHLITFPNIFV